MMRTIAWAAGIIEGEGYIGLGKAKVGFRGLGARVTVCMTDQDVILELQRVMGGIGTIITRKRRPGTKLQWVWTVARHADLEQLLTQIKPYLLSRRASAADKVLSFIKDARALRKIGVSGVRGVTKERNGWRVRRPDGTGRRFKLLTAAVRWQTSQQEVYG